MVVMYVCACGHTHMYVTTITRFTENYTVAILLGPIHSFAVLYTEKLVFSVLPCKASWEFRGCTDVATL